MGAVGDGGGGPDPLTPDWVLVLSRETREEGGALQRRAQEDGPPRRLAQRRTPRPQVGPRQQGPPPSTPSAGTHGPPGAPRRFGFPQGHQTHPPQQGECGSSCRVAVVTGAGSVVPGSQCCWFVAVFPPVATSGSSSRRTRAAGRGTCPQTGPGLVPPPVRGWPSPQTAEVGASPVAGPGR